MPKIRLFSLVLALALACTPKAKAPTALEISTTVVNLTDTALAIYIDSQKTLTPAELDQLSLGVVAVEQAASLVRSGRSICPVVRDLAAVSARINCKPCLATLESLKCQ
jgi:hypothetical protein